jgi:hypothetical protein
MAAVRSAGGRRVVTQPSDNPLHRRGHLLSTNAATKFSSVGSAIQ